MSDGGRIFQTSLQRRELLARLKEKRGLGAAEEGRIPRRTRGGETPLSFAQERLWFLDQLEPDNPIWNLSGTVRLRGRLLAGALAAALSEVVRRHEVLRSRFTTCAGVPAVEIAPAAVEPLPTVDLAALPPKRRRAETRRLTAALGLRPLPLATGPPFRFTLLRLGEREHALHLDLHHIVSDGWSLGVLTRELGALYPALAAGEPPPLPEPPIQYADYALWQREHLAGEVGQRQLAYWRRRLAAAPPALELPTDRPRGPVQTFRGEHARGELPGPLAVSLRALAGQAGASLFMVLLAAWKVLLGRWSGQDDVVVGSPVAGRNRGEVEGLIGLFLNHLVLRTDLAGNPSFEELLGRVKETAVGAYDHQDLPFERLLTALEPDRDLSRTPLFQVYFNLLNLPPARLQLPGLTLEGMGIPEPLSKFDLTLYVNESPAGEGGAIRLDLVYNADLFDRARMEEALAQYRGLLEQIAERPAAPVGGLMLRTAAAQVRLPDPRQPLDETWPGSLPGVLARHGRQTPRRPAVVWDGGSLSYGELAVCAGTLARRLGAAGVGRGDRVAVWGHRCAALVPAVHGVLAAGAATVLLDPAHPPQRNRRCLEAARPRGFLALAEAGPLPPEIKSWLAAAGETVCRLELPAVGGPAGEAFWGPPAAAAVPLDVGSLIAVSLEADDVACLTFTSGSTGEPKGVAGRHRSLTHFLPWQIETFRLGPDDRFCLVSGLAHDPLQRDLFTPLWVGAAVAVPEPERLAEPGWLAGWMARQGVTVAHLTPALGRLLAEVPGGGAGLLPSLRLAFFVGDALTRRDVERLRQLAPDVEVVNLYGTTETQRAVSWHPVDREAAAGREVLPLGRGMPGAQLLVLGPGGAPAGVGELGEIAVRSPHLAAGYLDDPEQTRRRFVPNPFLTPEERSPLDRLYRTGDLGRYLPDGGVEAAGRRDRQIKIRGFRIEPGEVEAALGRHPAVHQAVVAARGEGAGRRLVAWVVAAGEAPSAAELRRHLAARLPEAMIPHRFVPLDALPLTPNRKIDFEALFEALPDLGGEPGVYAAPGGGEREPPRPGIEEELAAIWRQVLGAAEIGRNDGFFALGGHSLAVTRVLARVAETFGAALPVRTFFERPTVAAQAAWIEELQRGTTPAEGPPLPPLEPRPPGAETPLSFAQERLWFLDRFAPGNTAYTLSGAVRLEGELRVAALEAALGEVVRRHAVLRSRVGERQGRPRARIEAPRRPRLAVVDLTRLAAAKGEGERRRVVERLSRLEGRIPFDLARGPLVRFGLLRLGERSHLFRITFHHLVADGWSLGVFTRELAALYEAFAAGKPSPLPELPLQYADFAAWQRRRLSEELVERDLAWWRRHLAVAPPALELPTDRPRPPRQDFRGGRVTLELTPKRTAALAALGRRRGATLFMTLTAALGLLLHHLSGQEVVVVGTPVAGRPDPRLERLMGLFLDVVPLAADLSGDPPFTELLDRVREAALGAFAHQSVPFERLLAELGPPRDPSRHPLFDVLVNVLNLPPVEARLPGLTLSLAEPAEHQARFALTLYAVEHEGRLRLTLLYQRALFNRRRTEGMLEQLEGLLEQVCERPEAPLSELSLLPERHRAVLPDPTRPLDRPPQVPVAEAVAARAREAPERTAVARGSRDWSYGELETAVAGLAGELTGRGLEPGRAVAVTGPRSFAAVAALLAVWRCGGLILPLDPALPAARRRHMIEAAGACWLLAAGEAPEELRQPGMVALALDPETAGAAGGGAARVDAAPPAEAGRSFPADAAYVFFTSGSRGEPKAVVGSHAGLAHFLAWQREAFGVGPGDRGAWLTGLSFDVVLRDLFLPLTAGATLCLPPESRELARELPPSRLLEWLESEGVTYLHTVPSLARLWLEEPPPGVSLASLRQVFFAGEPLPAALVERWRRTFPRAGGIVNLYGPTETTLAKCFYRVPRRPPPGVQPVGRPLPGTQVLVLAPGGRRCGVGEVGEIVLRTPFRSLGYLEPARADRERFFPNPFRDDPEDLLYATGDLGRLRPDGILEILGRLDDQAKIRGVRVEPEEVAAVLGAHPEVRAATVAARQGPAGEAELVAWLVAAESEAETRGVPSPRELRRHLGRRLPAPLIPSRFVFLDRLPLSPNGKVDRRALPPPEAAGAQAAATPSRPPRGRLEERLARIWEEVLGVSPVGAEDDFFDLGGHSLLALRLVSRIEARLGRRLPVAVLFDGPTVAQLARALAAEERAGAGEAASVPPLVAIRTGGPRPPLFLVHPGGGGVLCYAALARELGAEQPAEQPVYGLQAVGFDGEAEPLERVEAMADRYLEAVRSVRSRGPYHLGGWSFGGRIAYEMACRLAAAGEEVGLLALIDIDAHAAEELYRDEATVLVRALGGSLGLAVEDLQGLEGEAQLDRIVEAARRAGRIGPDFDRVQTRRLFRVFTANMRAARAYRPRPYPGRVLLVRAADGDRLAGAGPTAGWGELARGGVEVAEVPGDHWTLVESPHVASLARELERRLGRGLSSPHR